MGSELKDAKKQWRKEEIQGDEEMGGDGEMNQDLLDTLSSYLSCPRIPLVLVFLLCALAYPCALAFILIR